ncbi:hypothetical protein [Larkinella rosea]|uniref:hypothetical protein n=1 Tax=Larkinella rosea TaxID=2025312 RepID=UPI00163AEC66|nr:hypothetical protein [Larkinella rosea]
MKRRIIRPVTDSLGWLFNEGSYKLFDDRTSGTNYEIASRLKEVGDWFYSLT